MKRILMVIPFNNIYPPTNGGMLRCFNLLNQLCKYFQVTALMNQDRNTFMQAAVEYPDIKNCKIFSTKENVNRLDLISLLPVKYRKSIRFRYWNRSLFDTADDNYLLLYPQLKEILKKYSFDYVILEDMAITNLAKLVNRFQPRIPVIYDAYNINSKLELVALKKGVITELEYKRVLKVETSLFKHGLKIFTCSENDLIQLIEMNKGKISGAVIPNGVGITDLDGRQTFKEERKLCKILFCGSVEYLPNREGMTWFCKDVFPLVLAKMPDVKLSIVGRGNAGEELSSLLENKSIFNHGGVEKIGKYYQEASVAIVPLLSGSGTRLKLMEAMAYKVPVVSTSIGAEGINYTEGKNIMIGDTPGMFADRIIELLQNPQLANSIANDAFLFVKNQYDWDIIGRKMADYLGSLSNLRA